MDILLISVLIVLGVAVLLLRNREARRIVRDGFLEGLRSSGIFSRQRTPFPVEKWRWETAGDGEVCDDCLARAAWPARDIADWMKAGSPGTPESGCSCGTGCRCRLVPDGATSGTG